MTGPYDDIISLPHHTSPKHPRMAPIDRAAQFAPFAALTGHEAAIRETARLTDHRAELDEDAKAELDMRLRLLADHLREQPPVSITYFQPDMKKAGGAYLTASGSIKKIDDVLKAVVMTDGLHIPIRDIYQVEGELLRWL